MDAGSIPFGDDLLPSVPNRPFRSRALVYEDGQLLDWIVCDVSMVAERPGSFIHAGAFIHFTTSDGTDPRSNGKAYDLSFPQPFDGLKPYKPDDRYQDERT